MKTALFSAFCLMVYSSLSFAQSAQTFDITSYKLPAGWQQQRDQNSLRMQRRIGRTKLFV